MGIIFRRFLQLAGAVLLDIQVVSALPLPDQLTPRQQTITRDVVVLGGGATGTYAAVLLQDLGKSVAVVERNDRLGGHSETLYTSDGSHIDYGVIGFFNTNTTTTFLDRLDVESEPLLPASSNNQDVNFATGEEVDGDGSPIDTFFALAQYSAVLARYPYFTDGGYNLPDPVPEDLLISFGDFVEKYHVENIIPIAWTFAHSVGNMLDIPAIYVIQDFGQRHVAALLAGYVKPTNGTAELYNKAAGVLGSAVLYESTAVAVSRPNDNSDEGEGRQQGVTVEVTSSTGDSTTINAQKLLVTIPPTLENLQVFDLDDTETDLFSQWLYTAYYVGIVNNTGIPDDLNVLNTIPENPGSLPREPFVWRLEDMGVPGYKTVKIVGDASSLTEEDAQELLFADFQRMYDAGTFPDTGGPELVMWGSHTPTTMSVSPDAVRGGFYRDLYALQGHRDTFYTGLSFCSDYSTLLWECTDQVVGKVIA